MARTIIIFLERRRSLIQRRQHGNGENSFRLPLSFYAKEGHWVQIFAYISIKIPDNHYISKTNKAVIFNVSLCIGLTLATEDDADVVPGRPIYISALQENGLAERTKTIQV